MVLSVNVAQDGQAVYATLTWVPFVSQILASMVVFVLRQKLRIIILARV